MRRQKNIDVAISRKQCLEHEELSSKLDGLDLDIDEYDDAADNNNDLDDLNYLSSSSTQDDQEDTPTVNEIELINESLSNLTNRLITDTTVDSNNFQFNFNASLIDAVEKAASAATNNSSSTTSSSSQSPSNLLNVVFGGSGEAKSKSNKSLNSTTSTTSQSDSSSMMSVSPVPPPPPLSQTLHSPTKISSTKTTTTTTTTTILTTTMMKQPSGESSSRRMSKSPNKGSNGKYLISTNSMPSAQPKPKRLASLIRFSNGASFFSRSCPNDDSINSNEFNQNQCKDLHIKFVCLMQWFSASLSF